MALYTFSKKNAQTVFSALVENIRNNSFPYDQNGSEVPQNLVTTNYMTDLERANFWFYVCHYMRGSIDSNMCAVQLSKSHQKNPEFFIPSLAKDMDPEKFALHLKKNVINFSPEMNAENWIENSRRLDEFLKGDIRNAFKSRDHSDVLNIIINKRGKEKGDDYPGFIGFRKKMTGMITYFLVSEKLIKPFCYTAAVDFHLLRVMLATKIIIHRNVDHEHEYDPLLEMGEEALRWFVSNNSSNISEYSKLMTDLADGLWLLSSKLCSKSPWNTTIDSKEQILRRRIANGQKIHPMDSVFLTTKDGEPKQSEIFDFESEVVFDINSWLKSGKAQRRSHASCGKCPIQRNCHYGIPAGHYYNHRRFILRDKAAILGSSISEMFLSPQVTKKETVTPEQITLFS